MSAEPQGDRLALSRLLRSLESVLGGLIPEPLRADASLRHQAITTVLFGLSMALWAGLFAPIFFFLGSIRCALIVVCAGVSCVMAVLSLRVHRSLLLAINLIAGVVLVALVVLSFYTGGRAAPAMFWLPSVPIIAILLSSWRTGFSWLLAASVSACVVFGLDLSGWLPMSDLRERAADWLYILSLLGIITCTTLLCFVFDFNTRALRKQLESARYAAEEASRAKVRSWRR